MMFARAHSMYVMVYGLVASIENVSGLVVRHCQLFFRTGGQVSNFRRSVGRFM
jgi:hypothetical protein